MLRFQLDSTGNLMKDLIAFWPLDEPGGERRDMLGYNPLTDNATVTSAKGIGGQGAAGQFTKANREYLSRSDNPLISTGNINFTIAGWVYLDSLPSSTQNSSVAIKASSGQNEWYLFYVGATNRWRFQVSNDGIATTNVEHSGAGAATTGRWYFVAGWHDADNDVIGIQVDNLTPSFTSFSLGVRDGTAEMRIGDNPGDAGNAQAMDGRIAYVGFWKRVLSQQERTDLWNFGKGNRLISY